jgi:hypothetical protein
MSGLFLRLIHFKPVFLKTGLKRYSLPNIGSHSAEVEKCFSYQT